MSKIFYYPWICALQSHLCQQCGPHIFTSLNCLLFGITWICKGAVINGKSINLATQNQFCNDVDKESFVTEILHLPLAHSANCFH